VRLNRNNFMEDTKNLYRLRILSLGAGVQSSTILLMACKGLLPKPDAAIFADTGWETTATYQHLAWLKVEAEKHGIPVIIVQSNKGSIFEWSLEAQLRGSSIFSVLPFHTSNNGNKGMLRRQCTGHFKIAPIKQQIRKMLGLKPRQWAPKDCVEQWIGISIDEAQRVFMRQADRESVIRYPLIEWKRMTRHQCQIWLMENYKIVIPKSACIGCPFHSQNEWRKVKDNPVAWKQAIELDNTMREAGINDSRLSGFLYLHCSCKPLEEVDLSTPEERGKIIFDIFKNDKLELFINNSSIHVLDKETE